MTPKTTRKGLIENPIAVSIFIGIIYFGTFGFLEVYDFEKWKYGAFIQSVLSVFLGAGAIGIITGVIIMFQSSLESKKEKAKEIFDQKITLYKEVIDKVNHMFVDGKINEAEFRQIELMLLKLQLMAKDETIHTFVNFYKKVADKIPSDIDDGSELEFDVDIHLKNVFSTFVNQCRTDLELSDQKLDSNIFTEIIGIQKKANENITRKKFKAPEGMATPDLLLNAAKKLYSDEHTIQTSAMIHAEMEKETPGVAKATVRATMSAYTSKEWPHTSKHHYKRKKPHRDNTEFDWFDFKDGEYHFIG